MDQFSGIYTCDIENEWDGVVVINIVKECVEKVEKGYEAIFIYRVDKVPVLFSYITETEGEAYEKLWEFKRKYIEVCSELEG